MSAEDLAKVLGLKTSANITLPRDNSPPSEREIRTRSRESRYESFLRRKKLRGMVKEDIADIRCEIEGVKELLRGIERSIRGTERDMRDLQSEELVRRGMRIVRLSGALRAVGNKNVWDNGTKPP